MSNPDNLLRQYLADKDAKSFTSALKTYLPTNPAVVAVALKGVVSSLASIQNKDLTTLGDELI